MYFSSGQACLLPSYLMRRSILERVEHGPAKASFWLAFYLFRATSVAGVCEECWPALVALRRHAPVETDHLGREREHGAQRLPQLERRAAVRDCVRGSVHRVPEPPVPGAGARRVGWGQAQVEVQLRPSRAWSRIRPARFGCPVRGSVRSVESGLRAGSEKHTGPGGQGTRPVRLDNNVAEDGGDGFVEVRMH